MNEEKPETTSIVNYLLGANSFDGYWWHQIPDDKRPQFWWRKNLRQEWESIKAENASLRAERDGLIPLLEEWQRDSVAKTYEIVSLREQLDTHIQEFWRIKELREEVERLKEQLENDSSAFETIDLLCERGIHCKDLRDTENAQQVAKNMINELRELIDRNK